MITVGQASSGTILTPHLAVEDAVVDGFREVVRLDGVAGVQIGNGALKILSCAPADRPNGLRFWPWVVIASLLDLPYQSAVPLQGCSRLRSCAHCRLPSIQFSE